MDIQGNLSWLFSQPVAFWITAILLAILANFITKILQTGYVGSVSKFKSANIRFALKVINNASPFAKKRKNV